MQRDIFIDCGANVGRALKKFLPRYPEHKFFAFEPNQENLPQLKELTKEYSNREITIIEKAAWTHNDGVHFFKSEHKRWWHPFWPVKFNPNEGSTIVQGKKTGNIDYSTPIPVPSIDFSQWILDSFTPEDNILLKLDIEGAEYELLNQMIKENSINYIKTIFVEFHHRKLASVTKRQHIELKKELKKRNIQFKLWP